MIKDSLLLRLGGRTWHLTCVFLWGNTTGVFQIFYLPSFHVAVCWNVTGVKMALAKLYLNNLTTCGVPVETWSFFWCFLYLDLSCLTVHSSGCPAVYWGVWLASWFLWLCSRHPPWLPAWLMSLCLAVGVIMNYCGARVSHEPKGVAWRPLQSDCPTEVQRRSQPVSDYLIIFCLF